MDRKRTFRVVMGVALALIACLGVFVAGVAYANWSAQRRAREFCSTIPVGSDISAATARAASKNILWSSSSVYAFYFSGFIFDKAVCRVSVEKDGKVISKMAEMEYD